MRDTDYAYCVARLRASESNMLTKEDMLKLSSFDSLENAVKFLAEKKWITKDSGDIKDYIAFQKDSLWQILSESVPDKCELDVLCVLNDFFNIKAAVKCLITSVSPENYLMKPTTVDLNKLCQKLKDRDFSLIFGKRGETAKAAYETAVKSENGQNAEIIIDRAAIDCVAEYAKCSTNEISKKVSEFICDSSNIKIAVRCANAGKDRAFLEEALGNCINVSRDRLIEGALKGSDSLLDYLSTTVYAEGAKFFEKNSSDFEKWCDEKIIEIASKSKYTAFTFGPVCYYYYKRLAEIKNVGVILTALSVGADMKSIKERIGNANA